MRLGSRNLWNLLVPLVCLLAGFGFATSANVSRGTELRPEAADLAHLVREAQAQANKGNQELTRLQARLREVTAGAGQGDAAVAAAQARLAPLLTPAGLTAVFGPGLVVTLDDAEEQPADPTVDLNQLVVHQSDLQAVVNALWAGGAEAMSVAGQRIIPTSAVRCVGNTLLLNGQVYSPPIVVAAIGPTRTMEEALDRSPGVALFKEAADVYGLGYSATSSDRLDLPAFTEPLGLRYAKSG